MSLATRLKARREELKITQQQLADMLGVTNGAIGNYETGRGSIKADNLLKLCDILNCDPNYLFQDDMTKNDYAPAEQGQDLTDDEHELLTNFRASSVDGRRMILNYSECIRFAGGSLYSAEEQEKLSSAFHNAAGTKKPG